MRVTLCELSFLRITYVREKCGPLRGELCEAQFLDPLTEPGGCSMAIMNTSMRTEMY